MSTDRRVEPHPTRFIHADPAAWWAIAILLLCLCASSALLLWAAPSAIQEWLATSTPIPTPAPESSPPGTNLADHCSVTALHSLPGFPPIYAVDGDRLTWWASGRPAPEWIEIDLGADYIVSQIGLLPRQDAPGITVHGVFVRGTSTDDRFSLLHTFHGPTKDSGWLILRLAEPLRGVRHLRIETVSSSFPVSWREIQVLAGEE